MASNLKRVMVKAKTGDTGVIKRLLHSHVGGYELPRSKKNIHASEVTKDDPEFCPRLFRLLDTHDVKDPASHIDTALEITFAEGRAKQKLLNEVWLRDRMVGAWHCRFCRRSVEFETFSRATAILNTQKDHTCQLEYDEVRVLDPVSGVSGGIDALVIINQAMKLRLVECKIMGTDQFKTLKMPLAEHRVRTSLYLRLAQLSKAPWAAQINTEEASVLYMMRGHGMKDENGDISPFKEFTVKRDTKEATAYLAKAHALTFSRKTPALGTPCGTCKTMQQGKERKCPLADVCFSGKFPGTITWDQNGAPAHTTKHVQFITNGSKAANI